MTLARVSIERKEISYSECRNGNRSMQPIDLGSLAVRGVNSETFLGDVLSAASEVGVRLAMVLSRTIVRRVP